MYKRIDAIEKKYDQLFKPLDRKREELINGLRDPEPEELSNFEEFKNPTPETATCSLELEPLKTTKGFPDFWVNAFMNSSIMKTFIEEQDKPVLKYLTNISTELLNDSDYKITFTFAPNEYFANTELTKTMIMDKDDEDICKETKGTEIQWKEGKNTTVKTIKKKQKNKKTKQVREITKTTECKSFFNFFQSRVAPENEDEEEEEPQESGEEKESLIDQIHNDMDIGEELLKEIVPKALFYYMNLADMQDEDDGDSCESCDRKKSSDSNASGSDQDKKKKHKH